MLAQFPDQSDHPYGVIAFFVSHPSRLAGVSRENGTQKTKYKEKTEVVSCASENISNHGRLLSEEEVYYVVCKKCKSMWGLCWENNTSIISYLENPESCLCLLLIEGCKNIFDIFSLVLINTGNYRYYGARIRRTY